MSSSNTKNILDEFFQNLKDFGDRLSMEDIDVAVESLQIAFDDLKLMKKAAVEKRKEAERKQREEDEKREKEEKICKQKKHIKEVTCMDLPLDWNNPFNADERASGIYIESISDALVKSLTTTPTNSHTANKRIIMVITNQANTVQTKNCFYFKCKFFNGLWHDITHSTNSMIFRSLR